MNEWRLSFWQILLHQLGPFPHPWCYLYMDIWKVKKLMNEWKTVLTGKMNFYVGLPSSLRTANWSFPRYFQSQLCSNFLFPFVYYIYSQSEPLIFHTNDMCKEYQLWSLLLSNILCAVNCQLMSDCCYRIVFKSLRLTLYHFASQQLWVGVEVGCSGSFASVGVKMAAF